MNTDLRTDPLATRHARRPTSTKPAILDEIHRAITEGGCTLTEIAWEQQRLHEARRWSVVEFISNIDLERLSEGDRVRIWNAGRAELTTKPGADRVARLADAECRRWQGEDDVVAAIMQACGTWSRYWNEEEAHHEVVFNQLSSFLGLPAIPDVEFIEYRKVFPDDEMLRTLTLLVISEIVAAVNYGQCAMLAEDPGLRALFKQVAADEIQHMGYFIAFAKGLVDSGAYQAKEAFAVAHFFIREGGDLYGVKRDRIEERDTHVNWWDHLEHGDVSTPDAIERKQTLIFSALKRITGISVSSVEEVEDTWMDLVGC
ncbi:MAG: ferritin-like domain-containing protein [Myxococcales bacterium]|nr:ferritin-like domain-containing protein [Myxococcales bacterium]